MSVLRVVDQGEEAFLDAYLAVAAIGGGHSLRLFTGDVEAGLTTGQLEALTEADFTEATFAGYAAVTVNSGWTTTQSDPSFAVNTQRTFTRSSTGTAQLIHGYYLTLVADGRLQWYEQFDGPVSIEFINDALRVTPRLSLEDTDVIPVGTIVPFSGSGSPSGWSACDGGDLSRTTFAALNAVYEALGYPYGNGNGSTTFTKPDLRQRFPMGVAASGTGNALGDEGGTIDHVHGLDTATSHARVTFNVGAGTTHRMQRKTVSSYAETHEITGVTGAAGVTATANGTALGGDSGTANPPFVALNYIVKL